MRIREQETRLTLQEHDDDDDDDDGDDMFNHTVLFFSTSATVSMVPCKINTINLLAPELFF